MSHIASRNPLLAVDIQGLMIQAIEQRFKALKAPREIQWLSNLHDNIGIAHGLTLGIGYDSQNEANSNSGSLAGIFGKMQLQPGYRAEIYFGNNFESINGHYFENYFVTVSSGVRHDFFRGVSTFNIAVNPIILNLLSAAANRPPYEENILGIFNVGSSDYAFNLRPWGLRFQIDYKNDAFFSEAISGTNYYGEAQVKIFNNNNKYIDSFDIILDWSTIGANLNFGILF